MSKKTILFAVLLTFVATASMAAIRTAIWGVKTTAESIETFTMVAVDDQNLHNDAGHEQALTQMLTVLQRRYEDALTADVAAMTETEQLDYFTALEQTVSSLGRTAGAISTLGYAEPMSLLVAMRDTFVGRVPVWTATVTNSIVIDQISRTELIFKHTTPS